jgi:hypothetical protein
MDIKSPAPLQSTKKSICWIILTLASSASVLVSSCAYRLTNLHTIRPENIRSIYVEGVYDTSAEPIPHERLWDELQRAIAANGQIRLAAPNEADAVLRAHIISTTSKKAGERKTSSVKSKKKDPEIFYGQTTPPRPGPLRDISIADDYFTKSSWSSRILIEIYDLRSGKLILQRNYPIAAEVQAVRGDQANEIHHLRHQESLGASFGNGAKSIAERIVSDLLVR